MNHAPDNLMESTEIAIGLIALGIVFAILVGGALLLRNLRVDARRALAAVNNGRPSHGGRPPSAKAFYRTQDGSADYEFHFINTGRGWKVYVIAQPSYNGRDESAHATHRLQDAHGRFICWSTPITSYEDAREIARRWAEATQNYIRTSGRF